MLSLVRKGIHKAPYLLVYCVFEESKYIVYDSQRVKFNFAQTHHGYGLCYLRMGDIHRCYVFL